MLATKCSTSPCKYYLRHYANVLIYISVQSVTRVNVRSPPTRPRPLVGNSSLAYPGGSYQVNASGMSSSMTWSFVPRAAAIAAAKNLQLSKGNPQRWSFIGQLRTGCSRSSFQDYTSNSARTGEHRTSHIITTSPNVAVTFGTFLRFAS